MDIFLLNPSALGSKVKEPSPIHESTKPGFIKACGAPTRNIPAHE